VKREVVELITPGTVTLDQIIESGDKNYLASIVCCSSKDGKDRMGLALLDLTTGEFRVEEDSSQNIIEKLNTLKPSEILLPEGWKEEKSKQLKILKNQTMFTFLEDFKFSYDFAYKTLTSYFKTASLDGFGFKDEKLEIGAAGGILSYLQHTKKVFLPHINKIVLDQEKEQMFLDSTTLRNLEVFSSFGSEEKKNTLFSVLNYTQTPMGARMLKDWILKPLLNVDKIKERQDAVAELLKNKEISSDLGMILDKILDIERLAGKLGYGKANPKDLIGLKESLSNVPQIKKILSEGKSHLLQKTKDSLPDTQNLVKFIEKAIIDEPPAVINEGGIIKKGYSPELDQLKEEIKSSREWIASLQGEERKSTSIPSLKVGFNKIFGYYIEVTQPHLSKVPSSYIRKQTMVNAERFVTPELKEKEELILGAEEKIFQLEYDLFLELKSKVSANIEAIQKTAELLAQLDVLLSCAEVAGKYNYVRPEIDLEDEIIIEEGRHPVIEQILEEGFIPNDTLINSEEKIHIITGPNMAGKSTYLRQVGLIVLLAQIGSFVPAKKAKIGLVDRIFTRVGAMDNITLGQSTFLVEMNETANILNNATSKSLILLDEIGRGTSTFDGLSLAWAITEFIHNHPNLSSRTLVATHYHELTELAKYLPKVRNYNVAVKEWEDEIIFLRKIIPGGCDDSYGIQVARLAGIPKEVLERAKKILAELEQAEVSYQDITKPAKTAFQLSFFSPKENEIIEELKEIDTDKLTPLEALNKLNELKKKVEEQ
jgi:DNA mismatch repair protein MutS